MTVGDLLDRLLPSIESQSVAKALVTFPLPLLPRRDPEWVALAVRRSLGITIREDAEGPERTSNADVRWELKRLADVAGSAWADLFQRDDAADSALWDFAWQHWDRNGETEGTQVSGMLICDPPDFRRFRAVLAELDWLAGFLSQAASEIEKQPGPWRQAEQRRLRIERARYLAPVFEAAFGHQVTANNWPSDPRHPGPTPFMEFFQAMMSLAFAERATPDLSGVIKAACQLHRKEPVCFAEGVIPGL